MGQITTQDDIKQLGTILSVWAHPDDETFTAGGIMATAVVNGQKVICITATKGEAGVQDASRWPAEKLGQIREGEMMAGLEILSVKHHVWLDYRDGHCHEIPLSEAAQRIKAAIEEHHPNTILTFGPDGLTGHADHQAISKWVTEAAKGTDIKVFYAIEEESRYRAHMQEADKQFNIYFNIDKPPVKRAIDCDIAYALPADILVKKRAALQAMPSQYDGMFKQLAPDTINAMLALECFVLAN